MKSNKSILLIEDDSNILKLLDMHLKDLGYLIETATNGDTGLEKALAGNYGLIILDLMLPGKDGFEVCKGIRTRNQYTPILMLTARSEELDKVLGLELGADDYLTKPFSIRELLARVKAIFRRMEVDRESGGNLPAREPLQFGGLIIDFEKRKVTLREQILDLTSKEFDLLALFAGHPGRTYTRQELLDIVWGYQFDGYDHTVNSHINRLRAKLEADPTHPTFIKTVWGVGYRFIEPEELD